MERKPTRDFLFIDETGDPGKNFTNGGSRYFAIGCIHVTDITLEQLQRHLSAMAYFSDRFRELKSSRLSRVQKDHIEDIAKLLCETPGASITVVVLDKPLYKGPYFQLQGAHPHDALYFRNFVTRQLLEHHFQTQKLLTVECDLIFDRAISESAEENLKLYLRGNYGLPPFTNIVQCDSRYIPALQFADAVVHIVKEYALGKRESIDGRLLRALKVVNINDPRNPFQLKIEL